jgi:hypothetical protein
MELRFSVADRKDRLTEVLSPGCKVGLVEMFAEIAKANGCG